MSDQKQRLLDGLPTELLSLSRYFPVNANKHPKIDAWSNPKNQRTLNELSGLVGFDTCGHERGDDYLLLDFDHVLSDQGEFVSVDAAQWFELIYSTLEPCYCETSISGHGIHILAKPTPDKFDKYSGGNRGTLKFEGGAKLELFYQTKARYCLLTGILYRCEAHAIIPSGEAVDEVFECVLDEISKRRVAEQPVQPAQSTPAPIQNLPVQHFDDDTAYDLFRARIMLTHIDCAALQDSDWLAVMSACKNIGLTYQEVDAFNRSDPDRYNESENLARWNSLNDSSFDIGTLHGAAKNFGYVEKSARREWFELHPKLSKEPDTVPIDDDADWKNLADIAADETLSHEKNFNVDQAGEYSSRLEYLQTQPQSPERDADIVAEIKRACDWKGYMKGGKFVPTMIKPTAKNIRRIFDNDPRLQALVGVDEFQGAKVFLKQAPWQKNSCIGEKWSHEDSAQLRMFLRLEYNELHNKELVDDAIVYEANQNSFHAVKEFFANLPEWDKKPRAATVFSHFLKCPDNEYTRTVTMNWLLGAIARVYNPGCDYSVCIVIQGGQRIGKSRLCRMLGGALGVNPADKHWHVSLRDSVDDRHAVEAIQNGWIVEFEEFYAGTKADVNALKSFLTTDADTQRLAYERDATPHKRHCVFVVTTNQKQILRDSTGNTRFYFLQCTEKKFDRGEDMKPEYIRQVWSETLYRYNEMFANGFDAAKLQLPIEIQKHAEELAGNYVADDGLKSEILGYLDRAIPPQFIWKLLTREERRQFFVDSHITIEDAGRELYRRRQTQGGRKADIDRDKLLVQNWLYDGSNEFVYRTEITRGNSTIKVCTLYGSEYRQHICAAEIFNEAFGNDRRKSPTKINEILETLEGWHPGKRLRNADPIYRDQLKPYYRDENNNPEPLTADDDFAGEPVDDQDTPF